MTLAELRTLPRGARVRFTGGIDRPEPALGYVVAAGERCLDIHWPDGTSTLIWFAHCEDGRDARFAFLKAVAVEKAGAA